MAGPESCCSPLVVSFLACGRIGKYLRNLRRQCGDIRHSCGSGEKRWSHGTSTRFMRLFFKYDREDLRSQLDCLSPIFTVNRLAIGVIKPKNLNLNGPAHFRCNGYPKFQGYGPRRTAIIARKCRVDA